SSNRSCSEWGSHLDDHREAPAIVWTRRRARCPDVKPELWERLARVDDSSRRAAATGVSARKGGADDRRTAMPPSRESRDRERYRQMSSANGRVLVIAAHPDDPDFLAGGTVARFAKEGREVAYVIVTNGNKGSGDRSVTSHDLIPIRERE